MFDPVTDSPKMQAIDALSHGAKSAVGTAGEAVRATFLASHFVYSGDTSATLLYCRGVPSTDAWNTARYNYILHCAIEGDYVLRLWYDSAVTSSMKIIVNGVVVRPSLSLPSAGGWGVLGSATAPVHLRAGYNGLRLVMIAGDIGFQNVQIE
jgi:hypothetical protein